MDFDDQARTRVERYWYPLRPELSLATTTVAAISNPLQAWEKVKSANLLSETFFADHRRMFAQDVPGELLKIQDRRSIMSRPSSVRAVIAIASDLTAVLAAEAHARELARRLVPWTGVCDDKVVWHFSERPLDFWVYLGIPYDGAIDTVNWTLDEYGVESKGFIPEKRAVPLPNLVRRTLGAWRGWNYGVEQNFEILEPRWPLDFTKWRFFSDLTNPFDPMLDLWRTGYHLISSFQPDDPMIHLYMPISDLQ